MYADRITETATGKLLGVQILERTSAPLTTIEHKRTHLFDTLTAINSQAAFFKRRGLFCSIVISDDDEAALLAYDSSCRYALAKLPFVTLQLDQRLHTAIDDLGRGTNAVWLGDVGNDVPFTQSCEVAVLNEEFSSTEMHKETFPVLINNIRRYCDRVVVRASDFNQRKLLQDAGVWACSGLYSPTVFNKMHLLM